MTRRAQAAAAVALLGACSQPAPPPATVPAERAPFTPEQNPPEWADEPPTTVAATTTTAPPVAVAPTTAATAPAGPSRVPAPVASAGTGAGGAAGDVWAALSQCESGNRNLRNPPYSGFFQFTGPTWRSLGYSGVAADHPYSVQLEAAKRLLARSGASQWPTCGRRVGL